MNNQIISKPSSILNQYVAELFPQWQSIGTPEAQIQQPNQPKILLISIPHAGRHMYFDGKKIYLSAHHGAFHLEERGFGMWNTHSHSGDIHIEMDPAPEFLVTWGKYLPQWLTPEAALYGLDSEINPGRYIGGSNIAMNLKRALAINVEISQINYIPGATMIAWNSRGSTFEGTAWQLWSDGVITRKNFHDQDKKFGGVSISKLNENIRNIIVYTDWKSIPREDRAALVQKLMSYAQISCEVVANSKTSRNGLFSRSSADTEIKHIIADNDE
jgi:hypothetical protein